LTQARVSASPPQAWRADATSIYDLPIADV
jgi:hypothetical protein